MKLQRLTAQMVLLLLSVAGSAVIGTALGKAVHAQNLFGSNTGLPLPRFVSLASNRINVRTGPSKDNPIRWVFTHAGLPVQVTDEADDWRKILDFEGEVGWIHTSLLKGERTVLVTGDVRNLYRTPSPDALVTARLEPGVIAELINCETSYCYIDINGRRGWLERAHFWGVLEGEMP